MENNDGHCNNRRIRDKLLILKRRCMKEFVLIKLKE